MQVARGRSERAAGFQITYHSPPVDCDENAKECGVWRSDIMILCLIGLKYLRARAEELEFKL